MPEGALWALALACGALLGLGSLWVPGSNDGLLLLGLPLLWPHAWAALAVMMATIALLLQGQRHAAHRSKH